VSTNFKDFFATVQKTLSFCFCVMPSYQLTRCIFRWLQLHC